jgi:hypothetical protein
MISKPQSTLERNRSANAAASSGDRKHHRTPSGAPGAVSDTFR